MTQVADFWGCVDGAAVHIEEISDLLEQRLESHNHELSFVTLKLE